MNENEKTNQILFAMLCHIGTLTALVVLALESGGLLGEEAMAKAAKENWSIVEVFMEELEAHKEEDDDE